MANNCTDGGVTLLIAATTSASGSWVKWPTSGRGQFQLYGTPNGAAVTLQVKAADGTTAIPVCDAINTPLSFTVAGTYTLESLVRGQEIRATVASAGGSTNLNAQIWAVI